MHNSKEPSGLTVQSRRNHTSLVPMSGEEFHIGHFIEMAMEQQGIAGNELSRRLFKSENFSYSHIRNAHINTKNLVDISLVLNTNLAVPLVRHINYLLLERRSERVDFLIAEEDKMPYGYPPAEVEDAKNRRIDELNKEVKRLKTLLEKEQEISALLREKIKGLQV